MPNSDRPKGPTEVAALRRPVAEFWLRRTLLLLLLPFVAAHSLGAQQPSATLNGVVIDASSGAPVASALVSVGERGPRAIADDQGRFALGGVPLGSQRIRVQRFGYTPLEISVEVTLSPAPLTLRMQVDPVALEGLTVTGGARVDVGGVVLDGRTGERVPWAEITITRDAVRDLGRGSADQQGVFSIEDVTTGTYLLRAERVGYEGVILPITVAAPPEPIELRLQPDSVLQAGLAALERKLSARRNASPSVSQSWGEDRLRLSAMRGMRKFLEDEAMLNLIPCGRTMVSDCRELRGNLVAPRVYIDEMRWDMDYLGSFEPHELYKVDVFVCGPGDRMGGWEIRAYTYPYIEQQMKRGRAMFASCFVP
jgi:hypothetical protein